MGSGAIRRPDERERADLLLYSYSIDGEIMVILATHVEDLLCVARHEYCSMVEALLAKFEVTETKEGEFRFCERASEQCMDYSVKGHGA